jgi:TetR/AcrR family transcriptional regulator, regulator of autoinduction and epiphytic fitness
MVQEGGVTAAVDGRTARALRTRQAIVDATIALVEAGDVRPTAPRVAERAGVSVRSVFQHFDDLETLYSAVADRLLERVVGLISDVEASGPLDERVARFVDQRAALLESITPIRRAAAVHAPFSREITERLLGGHAYLRYEVERAFADVLEGMPDDERIELLDSLDAALSWGSWDSLRSLAGCSPTRAKRAVARAVTALLGGR